MPVTHVVAVQPYSGPSRTEDCLHSELFQTTARHNPLVTMDTLAYSEYNLPQAVALALIDSASVFGAALQRSVGTAKMDDSCRIN